MICSWAVWSQVSETLVFMSSGFLIAREGIKKDTFNFQLLPEVRKLRLWLSFVMTSCCFASFCSLPMWRFLITGAEFNREIKVWCTVTWSCLQTIR